MSTSLPVSLSKKEQDIDSKGFYAKITEEDEVNEDVNDHDGVNDTFSYMMQEIEFSDLLMWTMCI